MKSVTLKLMIVLALSAMSLGLAAQEGQQKIHYKLINLGTLGGVVANPFGGVNNRTWLTGDSDLAGDLTEHGFLWRDGKMIDLGTLGGANSSVAEMTTNVTGLVVGVAQTGEPDPTGDCTANPPTGECWGNTSSCALAIPCNGSQNLVRGFVWKDGAISALPMLGGNNSATYGANNLGQIVGLAETGTADPKCVAPQQFDVEAVVWGPKPGEIRILPPLPGDVIGGALAINDRGQVVGGSGSVCGFLPFPTIYIAHAVLWQDGKPIDLGNLGGVQNNLASAINNRGQVVGASDLPGDANLPPFTAPAHAFMWQYGAMTDLGTLPAPLNFSSTAGNINDSGQVVGTSCDASFNCHGFLWEQGVMTDLNALLPAGTALQVVAAGGINDLGEIAVQVFDPASATKPFPLALMIPDPDADAAQLDFNAVSTDSLPDHVRAVLQQRMKLGPFGRARSVIPAHSASPNADALVSTLAGAKPSTSNDAVPQSCRVLGAACTGSFFNSNCCRPGCGPHRTCCTKPLIGMACNSNAECCSGLCANHICR